MLRHLGRHDEVAGQQLHAHPCSRRDREDCYLDLTAGDLDAGQAARRVLAERDALDDRAHGVGPDEGAQPRVEADCVMPPWATTVPDCISTMCVASRTPRRIDDLRKPSESTS